MNVGNSRVFVGLLVVGLVGCGEEPSSIDDSTGNSQTLDMGVADAVDVDDTAPSVAETEPEEGAQDIALDSAVVVSFDEAMDPANGEVFLSPGNLSILAADGQWLSDRTFRVIPEALEAGTDYQVTLSGFTDLAGNPLEEPFRFGFSTIVDALPSVTDSVPAEGAEIPTTTSTVIVTFDKSMDTQRGQLVVAEGGFTLGEPMWIGDTTISVPIQDLTYGVEGSIALVNFADLEGNALDPVPYLTDGALDFVVASDTDSPAVVGSTPMEGQVDVDPDMAPPISITFSEPMDTSRVQVTLASQPGSGMQTLTGTWDAAGTTITFPAPVLTYNSDVSIDLSGFSDAFGNSLDTVTYLGDGRLDFLTSTDMFDPVVVSSTPAEGAMNLPLTTSQVIINFSEAMDQTVTMVDVATRAGTSPIVGTWTNGGAQLTLDISNVVVAGEISVDLRSLQDVAGNPLDAAVYLNDGRLDISTVAPTGEDCSEPLSIAEATPTGTNNGYLWNIASGQTVAKDNNATQCDADGAGDDIVILYEKTTPSFSNGGPMLHLFADAVASINVEVFSGACNPSDPSAVVEKCLWNDHDWGGYFDLDPGVYYFWISRSSVNSTLPAMTVLLEEIATPPDGETCAAPFDRSSANYTPPSAGSGYHEWVIASDSIHAFDMGDTWGDGSGSISCSNDPTYGDLHGSDAVIRFNKISDQSTVQVEIENDGFGRFDVEVLDACESLSATASLSCLASVRDANFSFDGPAGVYYIWIAGTAPGSTFPGLTVRARETVLSPGESCANAFAVTSPGSVSVNATSAESIARPSCFDPLANVEWYRYTLTQDVLDLATNSAGAISLFSADDLVEPLFCSRDASSVGHASLLAVGQDVCIAVEVPPTPGTGLGSFSLTEKSYTGLKGPAVDLGIERPLNSTGSEISINLDDWMAVNDSEIFLWVSSTTGLVRAPKTGGVRSTLVDPNVNGIDFRHNGDSGLFVNGQLFTFDDTTTSSTRVWRLWDGVSSPWGPTPWDTGQASSFYPSEDISASATDGTYIYYATNEGSSTSPTQIYRILASASSVPEEVAVVEDIHSVAGMAIDANFIYLAAEDSLDFTIEGIYRIPISTFSVFPPVTNPERISGDVSLSLDKAPVLIDDPVNPTNLYFHAQSPAGIHAIIDPAGANPSHIGVVATEMGSDDNSADYNYVDDAIYFFGTEQVSSGRFYKLQ